MEEKALVSLFYHAVSPVTPAATAAAWLEGFLKGNGTILLLDHVLWQMIDDWIQGLDEKMFIEVLPLLRRTFSNFSDAERRKLGVKVKQGNTELSIQTTAGIDEERALQGIPVMMQLLGY